MNLSDYERASRYYSHLIIPQISNAQMEAVGAIMHKLIRVTYGVLKSGQPFDPENLIVY